jgi:flavorubredoxin
MKSPKQCIEALDFNFEFSSGRRLEFIRTPYAHAPGSFVTYDTKTKALFSSDIFGSYNSGSNLYSQILEECEDCSQTNVCPANGKACQIAGILDFHKRVMPSTQALRYALCKIEELDVSLIAPQHGRILHTPVSRKIVIDRLKSLGRVGIEIFLEGEGA